MSGASLVVLVSLRRPLAHKGVVVASQYSLVLQCAKIWKTIRPILTLQLRANARESIYKRHNC